MTYDLKPMKAPRAAGALLRALVAALESPATGALLAQKLLADAGVSALRERPTSAALPAQAPVHAHGRPAAPAGWRADVSALADALSRDAGRGFQPESAVTFTDAYASGALLPVDVAERALGNIRESDRLSPAMRIFIAHQRDDLMRQAQASTERWQRGQALGPLDGVPVAVKDEIDQAHYPTTVGTKFLGTRAAAADAEVVARFRARGALLLGKTNMHEIGIGVTGHNPHHGAARNPFDPARATGGSSSGSAAAVAAGICPIAVGADGGGSVRVPAAFCGQVGLKATFGRISEHGAAEVCWSVAHIGPIAATVRDAALAYAAMCGPDDKDANSLLQPQPELGDLEGRDLRGVRLGIYRRWFEDADATIVARCQQALEALVRAGARIVDIDIPDLEVMRVAHLITIVSEMAAAHIGHYREHQGDYALDTRLSLALGRRLHSHDYVHAQRHRVGVYAHFAAALEQADAIVTPTTACTAPLIPEDALSTGESNLEVVGNIMRFVAAANLTGLPAISVPAGYDVAGLPIGLQLIGRAWEEHLLLRLARAVERDLERRRPKVWLGYFA
jgi:Asp-tRNA(Asn)/Glu-tRNA(Gln) amidotransferase A subunit family amidase